MYVYTDVGENRSILFTGNLYREEHKKFEELVLRLKDINNELKNLSDIFRFYVRKCTQQKIKIDDVSVYDMLKTFYNKNDI